MLSTDIGYVERHGDITRTVIARHGTWAIRAYTTPDDHFYDGHDTDPQSVGLTPCLGSLAHVREHIRRDEAGLL